MFTRQINKLTVRLTESCALCYVNRGLRLISSKHPDFDASVDKRDQSLLQVVLQLVFDGRNGHKCKILLQLLRHIFVLCTILIFVTNILPKSHPLLQEFALQASCAESKCSQSQRRKVINLLLKLLHLGVFNFHQRQNKTVSALGQHKLLPRPSQFSRQIVVFSVMRSASAGVRADFLQYYGHFLSIGGKRDDG